MNVFVVQHLVTLPEATKIIRLFKQKKHSTHGYYFELQDLGTKMLTATALPGLQAYSDKWSTTTVRSSWWHEDAYLLRVYREVPSQ